MRTASWFYPARARPGSSQSTRIAKVDELHPDSCVRVRIVYGQLISGRYRLEAVLAAGHGDGLAWR
jgi:hypothetical protein